VMISTVGDSSATGVPPCVHAERNKNNNNSQKCGFFNLVVCVHMALIIPALAVVKLF